MSSSSRRSRSRRRLRPRQRLGGGSPAAGRVDMSGVALTTGANEAASSAPAAAPVVELREIVKTYAIGDIEVHALRGVCMRLDMKNSSAIQWGVRLGKSTLMNIIGCMTYPPGVNTWLDGVDVRQLDDVPTRDVRSRRDRIRVPELQPDRRAHRVRERRAAARVRPLLCAQSARRAAAARSTRWGCADRAHHVPSQLSGGQQQRVAIARAIVTHEPRAGAGRRAHRQPRQRLLGRGDRRTDSSTAAGRTVVMITHEDDVAAHASAGAGSQRRPDPLRRRTGLTGHTVRSRGNLRVALEDRRQHAAVDADDARSS